VEDSQIEREIILEADAETLERMRKEGHAHGFTVFCDEGERIGGENNGAALDTENFKSKS
jgi:hypothetical protein